MSIRNLLPVSPNLSIEHMGRADYEQYGGLLIGPASWRSRKAVAQAPVWAMDNGAFTGFNADKFRRQMDRMSGLPKCLFVVAPDVVCDHQRTLEYWQNWHAEIKERGYPAAFVLQNGVTLATVPQEADAVFIGGDTHFKFTQIVRDIVQDARSRGKWVHNGRVNSIKRITYSLSIGCHSFDGTNYAIDPPSIRTHLPSQTIKQGLLL